MPKLSVRSQNAIVISAIALLILMAFYEDHARKVALEDYIVLTATITSKAGIKGSEVYNVEFNYHNWPFHNDFSLPIQKDTLNVGDSVLIKVARYDPQNYIDFIKRK
jgi:hypothetical protein